MTQCLITTIWRCLMQVVLPSHQAVFNYFQHWFFRHFRNTFIFSFTTLYIRQPKTVLHLMHLKKDRTGVSIYRQPFMEIRARYRDYIPVYTEGSRDGNYVAWAAIVVSNTVISMRLPDSASIFIAQVWAIVKALEQIKDSFASKYIYYVYKLTFVSPDYTVYEAGTSLDWDTDTKVCRFNLCQKGHYFMLGTQPCWHQK